MKNAASLFRNHNRSALEAGTYITHRVIYYSLVYIDNDNGNSDNDYIDNDNDNSDNKLKWY